MTHISKKSFHLLFSILILCLSLAGCGKRQEDSIDNSQETMEFYDIITEKKYFPEPDLTDRKLYFLGMQFYQEEPVQLWGRLKEDFVSTELFLRKIDGTEEVISTEIPAEYFYTFMEMYLDRDRNLYCYSQRTHDNPLGDFVILDSSGKELYSTGRDDENYISISYIYQVDDGSVYYIYYDEEGEQILGKSQPGSPPTALMSMDSLETSEYFGNALQLGGTEDQACVCMADGFWQLNPEEKTRLEILLLKNTSYCLTKGEVGYDSELHQAFRVLEDGSVETLWCFYEGNGAYYEKLTFQKVEKIPLVLRSKIPGPWLRNRIGEFNRTNDTYHIILEEFLHEGDIILSIDSEFEDYSRLTNIQLAAGKGPDLLHGDELLGDSAYTIMEKGIFQDLRPYMEAEGIREEDYFPNTFCRRYSEKIYGVLPSASLDTYRTDQELLDGKDLTDIETLLDALLSREESAVYLEDVDSVGLLRLFLESSDDLWNMIDWEASSCNFNTELFAKLLEAAKRYGYDEKKQDPILTLSIFFYNIYDYARALESQNMVTSGVLFEDGCYAVLSSAPTISINANSEHKEGAWEFIKFLLGEESQYAARGFNTPMLKSAFEEWIRKDLKKVEGNSTHYLSVKQLSEGKPVRVLRDFTAADFPESKIQAYRDVMENARLLPLRIDPLLDIICEEAAAYFNGDKSIPEVTELIQNRVQLYLNEH